LSNALHFIGLTSTNLVDGDTTSSLVESSTGSLSKTANFTAGDVVIHGDDEFVWTGNIWARLGYDTSFLVSYISYGKINLDGETGTNAVTANTTQLAAVQGNEILTFKTGNKWLTVAGTNGAAGLDVLTIGHSLSGVNEKTTFASNATTAYADDGTITISDVKVDTAGHITDI